jgi:serine/threonine protein kinase
VSTDAGLEDFDGSSKSTNAVSLETFTREEISLGLQTPNSCESSCDGPVGLCVFSEAYELEDRVLGAGGQGTVRLGRCRETSQEVAVKIISKTAARAYRNARRESVVHCSLVHDHVCPLIGVYEDKDNLYLILELIAGRDLFEEVLIDGPLQEASAAAIIKQLLEALEYCHEEGVLHRDIKAENVLLKSLGKQPADNAQVPSVFLADFGLAMEAEIAQHAPQAVVGTEPYLSPEAHDGEYSFASDMWSVGKVLCFMLFGRHVENWQEEEWAQFSAEVRDFAAGLLCASVSQRLTATAALTHPWLSIGAA